MGTESSKNYYKAVDIDRILLSMPPLPVFNYRFTNANSNSGVANLYIDGAIVDAESKEWEQRWEESDSVSTSFKSFRDAVLGCGATTFNVYINSGGGMVTEAMAIHDLLKQIQKDGKTVNTIGQGLVASAATYILMAGNSSMTENSWFMIHNVASWISGDVDYIEAQVKTLRTFNNAIRDFYTTGTGMSATEIENLMKAETWMTAKEAQDKKFVGAVVDAAPITNSIKTDKLGFKNTLGMAAYNSAISTPPSNSSTPINSMKKKFLALLNKMFDGKAPANVDLDKLAGDLENEVGTVPTNESILEMVKNAVSEALAAGKEEEDTEDETTEDAPENEDADGAETDTADEEEEEKPVPAKGAKENSKPAENAVSQAAFLAMQNEIKNLKKQLANKAGNKAKPTGNNANSDEPVDVNNHEGVSWGE